MGHQLKRLYKRPQHAGKPKRAGRPRPVEARRCPKEGKVCYPKQEARAMQRYRSMQAKRRLRCYPCPVCHHWHLTSKSPGRSKEMDREPGYRLKRIPKTTEDR